MRIFGTLFIFMDLKVKAKVQDTFCRNIYQNSTNLVKPYMFDFFELKVLFFFFITSD